MWLLTCSGDLLNHKTLWLRPGSGHLLGRTSGRAPGNETVRFINHKSVSRKHAILRVAPISVGASGRLHEHSEIAVTDSSKTGTYVDGEKIRQESKTLSGREGGKREWTIKLGNYEQVLRLEWRECVCSFTNLSKGSKAKGDALAVQKGKLEGLDVKVVAEYVANRTTHVVGKKRNTPAGLQALLQGRWVVTEEFVDALVRATTRGDVDAEGEAAASALEEDFEANWPREEGFILPSGAEPNPRPNEFLKPNAERAELFSGFSVVFLSQSQFDSLMPVVTSGGGKALLWEVKIGKSSVDDLVGYIKEVAGTKVDRDLRLSQHTGKGGIVVVRLGEKDDPWVKDFLTALEIRLEQRSAEQNRFLDAILTLDTSELRKPLRHATPSQSQNVNSQSQTSQTNAPRSRSYQQSASTPNEAAQTQAQQPTPSSPEPAMPPPARPATRRFLPKPKFTGFDDFEPSQFTRAPSDSPEPEPEPEPSQAASEQGMDVDEPAAPPKQTQPPSRKRPAASEEPQTEREMIDNMLQGRAAYSKRQKTGAQNAGTGSVHPTPGPDTTAAFTKVSKKKPAKNIDVRAELAARRKREEEARQHDEETLRHAMDGLDFESVKPKIETYELKPRAPLIDRSNSATSERWDPAWNGRRNFKRFRRQGARIDGPRLQRVIVRLEEVPRKDKGLGDDYWLESSTTTSSRNKGKSQASQTQRSARFGAQDEDEDEEDDPARFRRRVQNSRREDAEAAAAEETLPVEIAGRPRDPGVLSAPRGTADTWGRSQTGKRSAAVMGGGSGGGAAKRPRQVGVVEDEEEDALKFRRRKRP